MNGQRAVARNAAAAQHALSDMAFGRAAADGDDLLAKSRWAARRPRNIGIKRKSPARTLQSSGLSGRPDAHLASPG
jgi:hypothetical protein